MKRILAPVFGKKALCILLSVAMLATFGAATAQAAPSGISIPVTGTPAGGGNFTGTLNLQKIAVANNALVAVGTLTGTVTNAAGAVVGSVVSNVSIPLDPPTASCEILHLVLGPLDLNLLGLTVHLNQVVLDISAVPGAGNLLGNLLCAVANLLNGGGPLGQIANLLNQILGILGSL
jgi:hypothetical protein